MRSSRSSDAPPLRGPAIRRRSRAAPNNTAARSPSACRPAVTTCEVATTCARSYVDWADVYPAAVARSQRRRGPPVPGVARRARTTLFSRVERRVTGADDPAARRCSASGCACRSRTLRSFPTGSRARAALRLRRLLHVSVLDHVGGLRASAGVRPDGAAPDGRTTSRRCGCRSSTRCSACRRVRVLAPEEADLIRRRFRSIRRVRSSASASSWGGGPDAVPCRAPVLGRRRTSCTSVGSIPARVRVELFDFFVTYKRRNPVRPQFVLLGDPLAVPRAPRRLVTGFVDDDRARRPRRCARARAAVVLRELLDGADRSVRGQPPGAGPGSLFRVLGHARRSGAALPYAAFAEFEAAVDLLFDVPRSPTRWAARTPVRRATYTGTSCSTATRRCSTGRRPGVGRRLRYIASVPTGDDAPSAGPSEAALDVDRLVEELRAKVEQRRSDGSLSPELGCRWTITSSS